MSRALALAAALALLAPAPALAEGFDAAEAVRSALAAGRPSGPTTTICVPERASGRVVLVCTSR